MSSSAGDRVAPSGPAEPRGASGPARRAPAPEQDGDVERARRAIDEVRGHPAQRRHRERNAAEAGLRAARLSAAIDGVPLSVPTTTVSPVLVGAVRAGAALPDLVGAWQRSPRQVLARLHLLAAAGVAADGEVGRPRPGPGAASALGQVSDLVLAGGRPAPQLVALVHRELVVTSPFATANGVVARAAARLTMMATGLDPDGLTVPEIAYLRWFRPDSRPEPIGWDEVEWTRRTVDALVEGAREAITVADSVI
ncbi:oxidoreductase [Nakamurella flava]|uniref:oxidoreductase n=1 Tax=Nakamurella flava TaxID=2576308 RepID=UPI00197BC30B|nr:oxidoreductase [Nakamurella flava]